MAISQNSIQALDVLNQLLARADSGREADKNRAMRIMEMKIASDESEANRLNNYLGSLMAQNAALEQEYVKTTGMQRQMDSLTEDPDYPGSGAGSAVVGQKRSVLAMDRQGLKQQIAEAESERQDIFGRLGMYYEAYNRLAPEQFERYVASGKDQTLSGISTIGDDEWTMIKEDLKVGGVELSPEREAGLKKAFNALGAQRFEQEYKERYLDLQKEQLRLQWRRTQAAGKEEDYKDFMARHREKINRTNETAKRLGLEYNIDLTIPLSAQTTAIESAVSAGKAAMEFLIRGGKIDLTRTPGMVKDIIKDYKKAKDPETKNRIAMQLMSEFDRNPELITSFDYKGWSFLPWKQEAAEVQSGEPGFVSDLVDVWRSAMWFEMNANVNQPAGAESLTFGVNAKTEGRPPMGETQSQPSGTGFWDNLFDSMKETFGTPPPDAKRPPSLLDMLRRDKPLITIGKPRE